MFLSEIYTCPEIVTPESQLLTMRRIDVVFHQQRIQSRTECDDPAMGDDVLLIVRLVVLIEGNYSGGNLVIPDVIPASVKS